MKKTWEKLSRMTTKSFWCLNCRNVKVVEMKFKISVCTGSFASSPPTGGEPDMRCHQGPGVRCHQGPDMKSHHGPGMRRYLGLLLNVTGEYHSPQAPFFWWLTWDETPIFFECHLQLFWGPHLWLFGNSSYLREHLLTLLRSVSDLLMKKPTSFYWLEHRSPLKLLTWTTYLPACSPLTFLF